MQFVANLGTPSLADVGYTWKDAAGADLGTRSETGVVEAEPGYYVADLTPPAGAAAIYWDSTSDTEATAWGTVDRQQDILDILALVKGRTDLIDAGELVVSAPVVQAGNQITARAGDTWGIPLPNLANLAGRVDLVFEVHPYGSDGDADDALVSISEVLGLTRLAMAAAADAAQGALVVSEEELGSVVLAMLSDEASLTLAPNSSATWALKALYTGGSSETLAEGPFVITGPAIRRTSP